MIDFDKMREGGFDEDYLELPGNFIVDEDIDMDEDLEISCLDPMDECCIGDLLLEDDE